MHRRHLGTAQTDVRALNIDLNSIGLPRNWKKKQNSFFFYGTRSNEMPAGENNYCWRYTSASEALKLQVITGTHRKAWIAATSFRSLRNTNCILLYDVVYSWITTARSQLHRHGPQRKQRTCKIALYLLVTGDDQWTTSSWYSITVCTALIILFTYDLPNALAALDRL